jgi:hypothetical protein
MKTRLTVMSRKRSAFIAMFSAALFLLQACASSPPTLGQSAWDRRIGVVTVTLGDVEGQFTPEMVRQSIEDRLSKNKLFDTTSKTALSVHVATIGNDKAIAENKTGWVALYAAQATVSFGTARFVFPVSGVSGPLAGRQPQSQPERFATMVQGIVGSILIESRIKQ